MDRLAYICLILLAPLFFYNLGGWSLVDFDEAWYGEIARNILTSGNPFVLSFNAKPYFDHPPLGFIFMATSQMIFGSNEFAVRLPSALCGFGSLILTYLVGKRLFSKFIGLGAMLVLASSVWFILRSRQGDLDSIQLFFYLLTIYLALKMKEHTKWVFAVAISSAFLFLTKSFFGLTIIPVIVAIILIEKMKIPINKFVLGAMIFSVIVGLWFIPNYAKYKSDFVNRMIGIGIKLDKRHPVNFREIHRSLTFIYLHEGIRKWFYPAIFSMLISTLFILRKRNLLVLYIWILIPTYGFLTSAKTEIWHIIPIYPALAILIPFTTANVFSLVIEKLTTLPAEIRNNLSMIFISILFTVLAGFFIIEFRNEIKLFDREQSPLAEVASYAKNFDGPLFISSDLSIPATAVFYSQRQVRVVRDEDPPINTIPSLIEFGPKPFLLITEGWRLKLDKVDSSQYRVLKQVADYQLLLVN